MPMSRLTIAEQPGIGVVLNAEGDYPPGDGGLCEELMMEAVRAVQAKLLEREDMNEPQILKGSKETIRQVYGDEAAEKHGSVNGVEPETIEPGTILRFPQP